LIWFRFRFLLSGVESGSVPTASVCAMRSRVGHRVKAVWVAWWFGDWCGSSFELLPLLGKLTGYGSGPGWAMVGLSWAAHWATMRATHK
jgi:hypothetical protein